MVGTIISYSLRSTHISATVRLVLAVVFLLNLSASLTFTNRPPANRGEIVSKKCRNCLEPCSKSRTITYTLNRGAEWNESMVERIRVSFDDVGVNCVSRLIPILAKRSLLATRMCSHERWLVFLCFWPF